MSSTMPIVDDPNRDYGDKIVAVEPGGVEFIPLDERHGTPLQMLWTWTSPNMEFATVAVGILGPLAFGLTFWHTVLAILLGTALGAGSQAVLSTWGPKQGLPQMVISRSAFGFFGNALPAGLNAVVAGVGWFAVNSVSGALALHALFHGMPKGLCLVIVVIAEFLLAFFGHNLVQAFEKYAFPVLAAIFVVAWVVRRMRLAGNRVGGGLDILADVPLGQKERAVLLKVGNQQILLGVAPGRVSTLHVLPEPLELAKPPAGGSNDSSGPTFRNILMRSLGK